MLNHFEDHKIVFSINMCNQIFADIISYNIVCIECIEISMKIIIQVMVG